MVTTDIFWPWNNFKYGMNIFPCNYLIMKIWSENYHHAIMQLSLPHHYPVVTKKLGALPLLNMQQTPGQIRPKSKFDRYGIRRKRTIFNATF